MAYPESQGFRTFEFSDGLDRFALTRSGFDGMSPNWAVRLLERRLSRDPAFRRRLVSWVVESRASTVFFDEHRQLDRLLWEVQSGWLQVVELGRVQSAILDPRSTGFQSTQDPSPRSASLPPIIDLDRSLLITRCDPQLNDGPLEFTYVIHGLQGRPATLRIISTSYPGQTIYERWLPPAKTTDGPHDTNWDGVVTVGPLQGRRLSATYSPATVEVRHDDIYCDEVEFVIPQPTIVLVEVGGLCFETDREVLLPDTIPLAAAEPGPERIPSLVAIEAVIRYANQHPDKRVFVTGHTDTVGSDADNFELSSARAQNVQLYVSGDREGWIDHCLQNFETADQQRVLAWVARTFSDFDCDPGPIDNDFGPLTRAAQTVFRAASTRQSGEEMPTTDTLAAADWRAFYSLYDQALQNALGDDLDLAAEREKLVFTDPAFAGFGESFPSDSPHTDDFDSERNRRVDLIFLDEAEVPLAADTSGENLYGGRTDVIRQHIPLGFLAGPDEIALRLIDEYELPVDSLTFEIEGLDGVVIRSTTNEAGESRVENLVRGTYQIRLLGVDAVDWDSADISPRELPPPPTPKEYVEPDEGATGPWDESAFELVFDDDED